MEAEVEAFEAWEALAVVEGELREGGVGLAGAACAAEADLGGAAGVVAGACGGVEEELLGLRDIAGAEEVFDLVGRAVEFICGPSQGEYFSCCQHRFLLSGYHFLLGNGWHCPFTDG